MSEFTVSADIKINEAEQAAKKINSITEAIKEAEKTAGKSGSKTADAIKQTGAAGAEAGKQIKSGAEAGSKGLQELAGGAKQAGEQLKEGIQGGSESGVRFLGDLEQKGKDALREIGEFAKETESDMQETLDKAAAESTETFEKKLDLFLKLSDAARKYIADTVKEFEAERRFFDRYKTALGDVEEAQKRVKEVLEVAAVSTFTGTELTETQQVLINARVQQEGLLRALALLGEARGQSVKQIAEILDDALFRGGIAWTRALKNMEIKKEELAAFGAEMSEEGEILSDTAEQAQKAAAAVVAFANYKFGDAFVPEADKVTKAMQNAGESIGTFNKDMGSIFAPVVVTWENFKAAIADTLEELPRGLKVAAANVTVLVSVLGTAVGAAKGLAAAGIAVSAPWIAAITAISVAVVALVGHWKKLETIARATGDRIKESSKQNADALVKLRDLGGLSGIEETFRTKGTKGFKEAMKKAGWSVEDMDAAYRDLKAYRKRIAKEIADLQTEIQGDPKKMEEQGAFLGALVNRYKLITKDVEALEKSGAKEFRKVAAPKKEEEKEKKIDTKAAQKSLQGALKGAGRDIARVTAQKFREEQQQLLREAAAEEAALSDINKQFISQLKEEQAKIEAKPEKTRREVKQWYQLQKQIRTLETEEIEKVYARRAKGLNEEGAAYKALMKAKEMAISAYLRQEKKLEIKQKQTAEAEKTALEQQIELIKERYKIMKEGLPEQSEQAKRLTTAEFWEKEAAKQLQMGQKPESVRKITTKEYNEERKKIYDEFRQQIQDLNLTAKDPAYTSLLRARDARISALGEKYRTGVSAYEPKAEQEKRTTIQGGLTSLSDILKTGAEQVQTNLSILANALKMPQNSSNLPQNSAPNASYNININGVKAGADPNAEQIANAAAAMVERNQANKNLFGGSFQQ